MAIASQIRLTTGGRDMHDGKVNVMDAVEVSWEEFEALTGVSRSEVERSRPEDLGLDVATEEMLSTW